MIVTKEVKAKWNPKTRQHFEDLGYRYTKYNAEFTVPVAHLMTSSNVSINVKCDFCGTIMSKTYNTYNSLRAKNSYKEDLCKKCAHIKKQESYLKNAPQKRGNQGYWINRETRIKEFNNYIEKYKTVDSISINDVNLYYAIKKYDIGIQELAASLGHKWEDISNLAPKNYYDDFEKVKEKIEEFISENNRFPSQKELIEKYHIQCRIVQKHGGMDEIKRKMKYFSTNDLVDSNNYINKSLLEYQVAEFLHKNKVNYKRETSPFSGRQIRCDFEVVTDNDELFYVEVWGYSRKDKSSRASGYNRKRVEKTKLYKENNCNLIEIEYDDIMKRSLEQVDEYLHDKFKCLLGSSTKHVDFKYLVHPKKATDEEIIQILLSLTEKQDTLPTIDEISKNNCGTMYREALLRHGTYLNFAKKYGFKLKTVNYEWNDNTVNEFMFSLVQKGLPITRKNIEEHKAGGLFVYIRKTDKNLLADRKLDFYEKCIGDIDTIPSYDLSFLKKIADSKDDRRINKIDPVDSKRAKSILNKYHSKIKHNVV